MSGLGRFALTVVVAAAALGGPADAFADGGLSGLVPGSGGQGAASSVTSTASQATTEATTTAASTATVATGTATSAANTAAPAPVAPAIQGVTGDVDQATNDVGGAVDSTVGAATKTVAEVAAPVAQTADEAVAATTPTVDRTVETVAPVAAPVADTVDQVAPPVGNAAPIGNSVQPAASPVRSPAPATPATASTSSAPARPSSAPTAVAGPTGVPDPAVAAPPSPVITMDSVPASRDGRPESSWTQAGPPEALLPVQATRQPIAPFPAPAFPAVSGVSAEQGASTAQAVAAHPGVVQPTRLVFPGGGSDTAGVPAQAFFFAIFAALVAAIGLAAQRLSRWLRLSPDLCRPPLLVSVLERPG